MANFLQDNRIAFNAVIEKSDHNGAYVRLPSDIEQKIGITGRIKVIAFFDAIEYRGSLVKMGLDCHIIGVRKDILAKLGKQINDTIHVTIAIDDAQRIVELPEILNTLLGENLIAKQKFNALSYSHQREYVNWICEAKTEITRMRRIEKLFAKLNDKK